MKKHPVTTEAYACPECFSALETQAKVLVCTACHASYPVVGSIPLLLKHPEAALAHWQNKGQILLASLAADAEGMKRGLRAPLLPQTQSRIQHMIQAKKEHGKAIAKCLEPLKIPDFNAAASALAAAANIPESQQMLSYYNNLFRDWCWGQSENELSKGILLQLLEGHAQDEALVLYGAGACRLASDLHTALRRQKTYAADINPLMLLVAARILSGKSAVLYEFPLAPRSLKDHAVRQTLTAPDAGEAAAGLKLLLADALEPCFAPGSLGTIVTPWFIDILHQPFDELAKGINQQLKEGGLWVNFGSLAFFHHDARLCYSAEEILAILSATGFEVTQSRHDTIPYLRSPHSCQSRYEEVFSFAAVKRTTSAAMKPFTSRPDWLSTRTLPVPILADFSQTAAANQLLAALISLVDGKKSLEQLAAAAAPLLGLNQHQAAEVYDRILLDLYTRQLKSKAFR